MMAPQVGPDSVSTALVPAAGYSSNEGLLGGLIFSRYDYRGNQQPFKNLLETSAIATTKGFFEVEARYEQTRTFGREIRSIADAYFYRYTQDQFFGIGNETTFSDEQWDEEYYFFRSIGFSFDYRIRNPIYKQGRKQLDLQLGAAVEYHIPYINNAQSSFALQTPNGSDGGWVNKLNTGLIWENRDSEFDPHRGNWAELELRAAPKWIGNYGMTTARLEMHQYFRLFNWLTVANRLEARHVEGDIPYWELSTLGDKNTLRGYPLNRFKGNSSVAYTLELRTWLLKFPEIYGLKFGGQLFTDAGRVFAETDDINDLFEGYHQTVGFGGAMSVFNPDFILRGEIGFSEDVNRIYIGVGYMF
ncbi:hypothetical protein CK503_06870 [Aliifodinibius salipaludis]|uniref:Uncharacterized protein n=2 Tax=Fodinibius salipaludis TaxID=2032627 RepID=A0A2A2GCJ9_9BACT|nr:hypothetical protein CK503_06870 [Aliifodinibius salipaludis]